MGCHFFSCQPDQNQTNQTVTPGSLTTSNEGRRVVDDTSSGVSDPATTNCTQSGGTNEVFNLDIGQLGACRIDNALIGSWTLMRELEGTRTIAGQKFCNKENFSQGGGTPASAYCVQVGGDINSYRDEGAFIDSGSFCKFEDNSRIEEWTLMRGSEIGSELAALLKCDT